MAFVCVGEGEGGRAVLEWGEESRGDERRAEDSRGEDSRGESVCGFQFTIITYSTYVDVP